MMGMFDTPGPPENRPDDVVDAENKAKEEGGHTTDVEGVNAQDVVKVGSDEFPVFDCTENEFYQNMENGRKRIRFNQGSPASEYMSKTKYKRAFYIRTTDSNGKSFTRKIK